MTVPVEEFRSNFDAFAEEFQAQYHLRCETEVPRVSVVQFVS